MSRSDADYCDLSGTEAHSFTEHVPGILESRHTRIEFRPLSFRRMNSGTPLTGVLVVSRTGPVAVVRRQILVHGHCQTLYRTGTHTNPPSNADDNLGVTSALRLPVVPWTGTQWHLTVWCKNFVMQLLIQPSNSPPVQKPTVYYRWAGIAQSV